MTSKDTRNLTKGNSPVKAAPKPSPLITVWVLHWTSALWVIFLLLTSLTSGLGLTARLFPGSWMNWHLSIGILLLVATAARLVLLFKGNFLTSIRQLFAHWIKLTLLLIVFIAGLLGLVVFQKPPFGPSGVLFGSFPMPTLIRLDHSIHNVIINLHIALSCIIAVLLIFHMKAGFQRLPSIGRSRLAVMLWPWPKNSESHGSGKK